MQELFNELGDVVAIQHEQRKGTIQDVPMLLRTRFPEVKGSVAPRKELKLPKDISDVSLSVVSSIRFVRSYVRVRFIDRQCKRYILNNAAKNFATKFLARGKAGDYQYGSINEQCTFNLRHALNYARRAIAKYGKGIYDDSLAHDICNDAYIRWYTSRVGKRVPLDLRSACRFAVKEFRRKERNMEQLNADYTPTRIHSMSCRILTHALYASETHKILDWLASGTSQKDTAEALGMTQQDISRLVAKLRKQLS